MGYVGSKTRSQGQIEEKSCKHSGGSRVSAKYREIVLPTYVYSFEIFANPPKGQQPGPNTKDTLSTFRNGLFLYVAVIVRDIAIVII